MTHVETHIDFAKKVKIAALLSDPNPHLQKSLLVCGWIRTARKQKKVAFLEVSDGSSNVGLQVVLDASLPSYIECMDKLLTGASVALTGTLVPSPAAGQAVELLASEITLIGSCSEEFPLQKKEHSLEFLRQIAHLRPRTRLQQAIQRVRSVLAYETHRFFQERGFYYVHTPIITTSDCEGAGEMFRVTTLPPMKNDPSEDFFGKTAYLSVSGQLNGETMSMGLGDIYTFGPTFRAENSNTSRHLAEFWMIEPEMAFADLSMNMECAESYIQYLLKAILVSCQPELAYLEQQQEAGLIARLEHVAHTPFARATYTEAIAILEKAAVKFEFPHHWGADLQSEHERYLAEEHFKRPTILYNYPRKIKAFYMRDNEDGETVAAMDVLVPKIGELVGGSQREERLHRLEKKIVEWGLDPVNYSWYLDSRRFGSVPHAGFGLGFERLVLFATGMENIRDVIPFPRYPGHAEF